MPTSQLPHRTTPFDREPGRSTEAPRPAASRPPSSRVLALPAALAIVLAAFTLLTRNAVLDRTFLGAAGLLLLWCAALDVTARRRHRALRIEATIRTQHWLQACAQGTLILYWAWQTPFIRAFLPFVLVQLVFAYAFDSLLAWSRRDVYALGFGPFPVIFSINLFLLFRPEWFFWQFAMIALGFGAKELIRWNREGRRVHIFNPSSFPLSVFSIALLLTARTNVTFGNIIANTLFDTPHIYVAIFLVTLPAQLIFGVARTTIAAVVTMYALSLAYFAATGTYLFYDAHIPAAVFLGMHLLVTDPSTSPRSDAGRFAFGALYALGTTALFVVLEAYGAPTFYDKLLPIPVLNLTVQFLDRLARRSEGTFGRLAPARFLRSLTPARTHVAYTALWAGVFVTMLAVQGVGDRHPGQYLPFWHNACGAGSSRACTYAAQLTVVYCRKGSGWACNEAGLLDRRLGRPAAEEFRRACGLGSAAGCENLKRPPADAAPPASDQPRLADLPILLAGTKPPLKERDPDRLYALACEEGWPGACGGTTR